MSTIFPDCPDDMVKLWEQVHTPADPAVTVLVNGGQVADVPATLHGYANCLNDHTYFPAEILARCQDLRRIVFLGTGASSFIDLAAAERHGIVVDTIKGYGDTTVAEHTITLAMAAARSVARMDREVRAGTWRQIEGVQMFGKTLGVLGMGGIGHEVARIAAGIGMQVLAWNRSPIAHPTVELDELLSRSDILCVCLALNDHTHHFLDHAKLSRTKPGVILINTARANIVDNAALVELLTNGHIRHAGIDVFTNEPPLPSDPLLALDNVTLTAHAGFMTPEATMTMFRRALDIVAAK